MTIAKQLGAAKLFFVTDSNGIQAKDVTVPSGVYVSNDGIISQMTVTEAGSFIDLNSSNAKDPSVRLITCAYDACRGGVNRVHIIDGRVEGMLLKEVSSNRGYGTMIYANQHENIRLMNYRDIPFVLSIMEDAVEQDILVARSHEHLEEKIRDFFVYEVDGTIHGCGALHPFPGRTGEIAAVAVDETYTKFGIGKKIITFLIEQATNAKMKKVFVLTTQTSDWFQQLGFTEGGIDDLPEEKRKSYNPRRNSRVLIYTISTSRRSRVIDAE
jgi:amino-acid N-acetyltransferase